MDKTNNIYVIGAGCSQSAGAPLMADFLDRSYWLRRYSKLEIDKQSFDAVFAGIDYLNGVYARSILDLRNLESVFAAFEMADLFGNVTNAHGFDVHRLPEDLRMVIVQTLECTVKFPYTSPQGRYSSDGWEYGPAGNYAAFAETIVRDSDHHSHTILTFNYDIALDQALLAKRLSIDYCLGGDEPPDERIQLLKLHGSINWTRCDVCGDISAIDIRSTKPTIVGPDFRLVRFCEGAKQLSHCNKRREIAIVPPTWSKAQYHRQFPVLWRTAAQKLSEADNIFIMGYSLPATDQFFRYLYALGTMGKSRLQRVWVFNPDERCDRNFRGLLGPLSLERYVFHEDTFERAIPIIATALR